GSPPRFFPHTPPPPPPRAGAAGPPTPPPRRDGPGAAVPSPPPPPRTPARGDEQFDGLQNELDRLRRRVLRRRRRGLYLALGALSALLISAASVAGYWAVAVLPFASLQRLPTVRPGELDADRLDFSYTPASRGKIAFRRRTPDRDSELLDQVRGDAVGVPQRFQWRAEGVKAGDTIQVTFRDGLWLRQADISVPPPDETPSAGEAELRGQVVNAVSNQPIPRALVRLVGGSQKALADDQGWFSLDGLPEGNVPLEVSADGFTAERFDRVLGVADPQAIRVVLSPGLKAGQLRLVLTWSKQPADLDAHLEGPLPGGQRFHVYFHERGDLKSKEFVNLDVDDLDGEGPETITVLGVLPGSYRYWIHDYTNRDKPEANALARSGAEVRVYQGGQTYRFTPDAGLAGNVWNVCTIDVTADGATVRKIDTIDRAESGALGLYAKRTRSNRAGWIAEYGGTPQSEAAVDAALDWLARHQLPEGYWGPEGLAGGDHSRCTDASCSGVGGAYEAAQTGLALLAFQAGGHYDFNGNAYSPAVRRGLDWLAARQRPGGGLLGTHRPDQKGPFHQYYMYEHGIAAFALGEACAVARAEGRQPDPRYLEALREAMAFLERMQHDDGGWRYRPDRQQPSDTSVTGWQVLAIKTAQEAGMPVGDRCLARIGPFFDAHADESTGQTRYQGGSTSSEATTGVGMLARQFLLDQADSPMVDKAAAFLAGLAERTWDTDARRRQHRDYYLWYNCTLAMFHAGGDPWRRWNPIVRDALIDLQCSDGCRRGSWDPDDRWGSKGGRVYSTALAALCLEVYYRYNREAARRPAPVVTTIEMPRQAPELTERRDQK
ncbi:MAG: carboxypeptidase regulatory-like domain-containing protein, partial [Thermoguttaceae bacterium]